MKFVGQDVFFKSFQVIQSLREALEEVERRQ